MNPLLVVPLEILFNPDIDCMVLGCLGQKHELDAWFNALELGIFEAEYRRLEELKNVHAIQVA
jgi:hypothetical protein